MNKTSSLLTLAVATFLTACGGDKNITDTATKYKQQSAAIKATSAATATSILAGPRNNYSIVRTVNGFIVTDKVGNGGTLTLLNNVTSLKFSDVTVNLMIGDQSKTIATKDLQSLIELYVAFFNRVPDADGLAYWIGEFKNGQSLFQIADNFYRVALEFSKVTGYSSTMSNDDFVKIIYQNVLGRSGLTAPTAAELKYWREQLDNGSMSKSKMVFVMLQSAHEYINDPQWSWMAHLLDNKISVSSNFAIQQGLTYLSAEESISKTMIIAAAVTSSDITDAIHLFGITDLFNQLIIKSGDGTGSIPGSGSGTGSFTDCSIAALNTSGMTYQIDINTLVGNNVVATGTSKYKVNGDVIFQGHNTVETVIDTTVTSGESVGTVNTIKSYSALIGNIAYTYGMSMAITIPGFGNYDSVTTLTPAIQMPMNLAVNTPFTQSYTSQTVNSNPLFPAVPAINVISSVTFLGIENLTVPAGSFSTCKMKSETPGSNNAAYNWIVASGPYRGMNVKTFDGTNNGSEATKLLIN